MPGLMHVPGSSVLAMDVSNSAAKHREPIDEMMPGLSLLSSQENKSDPHPEISTDVMDLAKQEIDDEDGVPIEYDEPDFVWEEYLEETGAVAAPPTSFKHVECSLQSGFVKGMKLEVLNKSCPNTYWVASVVMTCGPLLRLRYEGYGDESSADFWCDVQSADIHPIGWCAVNSKRLQPPEDIKHKYDNWKEFLVNTLTGARTAPSYLLDGKTGTTPVDQIKQGMCLECQHALVPQCVWIVKILENVGGRLLLRYEGSNSAAHDFWMFYLNPRLHPIGWSQENNCIYRRPDEIQADHDNYNEWAKILQNGLKESENLKPPLDVFKDQDELEPHKFKAGVKLEVIHPINRNQICPGTVKEVINDIYFIIEIDDLTPDIKPLRICCHANSPIIFPVNWAYQKGIRITPPKGCPDSDFDWNEYIQNCKADIAPKDAFNLEITEHEFKRGMKLESVNPAQPYQICAATITKIVGQLMWIHLDNSSKLISTHIVDVDSHDIFPVGWCESNGYPLRPPKKAGFRRRKIAVVQPERSLGDHCTPEDFRNTAFNIMKDGDSGETGAWCPKIYFNHRCFSGPFLSKGRIAELPKCVGPGPVILVMKEVLSMLINVAYKSSRVLREIQLEGEPNPRMLQQMLKAKYKGKSYRAIVEICRSAGQIEEFCRQMCIKLECCPNMFGPHYVGSECPENCSQLTKTKYTYYYGKKKKRKIGRPPGGHTNLENGPKKPGKRRRRVNLLFRKKRPSADSDGTPQEANDDDDNKSTESKQSNSSDIRGAAAAVKKRKKRRYLRSLPSPPSGVKTRGAKLPKFSFERRTHKKIMLTKNDIPPPKSPSTSQSYKPVKPEDMLYLETNPLEWSVQDVIQFVKGTDCANFARLFKEHEIDGQALLLLTLPTVQEHMDLKLGPAIKLCHQVERVKIAFYEQFAK
ncbi:scm-like with four MBT domains protein 1 [Tubulanus polymorphus]|uniref:scm-like with four MBT domains protein 1 n=1 Tax=Tubulanus polymorphus TaxID=672921 RepID=UPI003DA591F4